MGNEDILLKDILQTGRLLKDILAKDILQMDILMKDILQTDILMKDILETGTHEGYPTQGYPRMSSIRLR